LDVGFRVGMDSVSLKASLEKSTDKVLHFIQANPGCHLRQIKKELQVPMGTIQYQLTQMEKMGKITSLKRGLYRFYFASGIFRDIEQDILQILSQETAREILMFIIERRNPSQTEIVKRIRLSPSSVNWHVKRLITSQIIKEVRVGRYKKYQLEDSYNSIHIAKLLRNYYPSIWNNWSIRVVETFLSLSSTRDEDIE
jgi:predicted transcriptional regulator